MTNSEKTKDKKPDQPVDSPSRRSFLTKLWIGLGIVAFVEFVTVILQFLSPGQSGKKSGDSGNIIEAGQADKFPLNSVTANIQGKFYLCRMEDGGFLALSSECTHLGCTVPWIDKENKFACPCHGSSFDIKGDVITSPAPRPLDIYPVSIENNIVKVDIRRGIKREAFLNSQVVYSKKVPK